MKAKKITSIQNSLIKELVLLRENKKQREKQKQALIFSSKIVLDVNKRLPLQKLFMLDNLSQQQQQTFLQKLNYQELFLVSEQVMKKITNLSSSEKVFLAATVPIPKSSFFKPSKKLLILDGLQDPLNVGSLIRTAHGLGWENIVLTSHTADPFNVKATRAAMGSNFFVFLHFLPIDKLSEFLSKEKFTIYLADLKGRDIASLKLAKKTAPTALILSNESKGVKNWTRQIAQKITIKLQKGLDSLNVSAAGAILMHYLS